MVVHDFTVPQLAYYREFCNFTPEELILFEYRSKGIPLEQCAENMNISVSAVKRLSRKVNNKMIYVTNVVQMDKWIREHFS